MKNTFNKIDLNKKPITIVIAALSLVLILFLIIPWYTNSQYDYSHVTNLNPTPEHIVSYASPLSFTMNHHLPIALLALVMSTVNIVMLMSDFYIIDLKHRRIVRIASISLFAVCFLLTLSSWITMMTIA